MSKHQIHGTPKFPPRVLFPLLSFVLAVVCLKRLRQSLELWCNNWARAVSLIPGEDKQPSIDRPNPSREKEAIDDVHEGWTIPRTRAETFGVSRTSTHEQLWCSAAQCSGVKKWASKDLLDNLEFSPQLEGDHD